MDSEFYIIVKRKQTVECNHCAGEGEVEVKVYHNQYKNMPCPMCKGKRVLTIEENEEFELTKALDMLGYKKS